MKNIYITLTLIVVFLSAFGCSKGNGAVTANYAKAASAANFNLNTALEPTSALSRESADAYETMNEDADASDAAHAAIFERKLVKSANIRIRVENLETADNSIANLMEKYGAYAAWTNIEENSRHYSLRVPAQYYGIFLAEMDGLGRLLNRYENTEDVTLRYYDLEGRLNTKKELLRTFQSYLGRANNIEEILAVETRIAELQYDIEATGIQFRNLANRVEYSTIELSFLGPVSASKKSLTFGERIKELFGGFGSFLSSVFVVIIGFIIYGIPVLLLFVLFFWVFFGKIGLLKKLWRIIRK